MSSRPSAFDALMANARAAAKKKPQPSSPKKRKTQDSNNPGQNPNSKPFDETLSSSGPNQDRQHANNLQNINSKPLGKIQASNVTKMQNPDMKSLVKKPRLITADESIAQLKKKPANFDPKLAAFWRDDQRVPFMLLVKAFDAISNEKGRVTITDIVCNMLRTVIRTTPDDLLAVVYLLANRIAPAHEGLELGIGDASIIKVLAEACGEKEANIKAEYTGKRIGNYLLEHSSVEPSVYGTFLVACYDSNNDEYESICKIGTGFSEAMLEEHSASLRSKVISNPKPYYHYAETISPGVWFEPAEVWEVKAADLTISPVHHAAIGVVDPDKGISLQFPRLVHVGDDKNPEQASSSDMPSRIKQRDLQQNIGLTLG